MSLRKVRILPTQAENLTADNNLLDLHIPGGGNYDASQSYISLIGKLSTTTAGGQGSGIHNLDTYINRGAPADNDGTALDAPVGSRDLLPSVALVKNAVMISQNKGLVENLRDVNKLRIAQKSYQETVQEKIGNAPTQFGAVQNKPWGYLSSLINPGVEAFGEKAVYIEKEIRIPLKDIFNVCEVNNLDTNYLGSVHIHLEMDMERLKIHNAYTLDNTPFTNGTPAQRRGFGVLDDDATNGQITAVNCARKYFHQHIGDCPFYEGQVVELAEGTVGGVAVVAGAGTGKSVITQISFANDQVILGLNPGINATAGGGGFTGCKLVPSPPTTKAFTISKVEMVMVENENAPSMSDGLEYTTYTTEKDNCGNVETFNRQYETEPEAINLLVHLATPSGLLSNVRPQAVRVSINNEQTTNRDIVKNSSVALDRYNKLALNSGQEVKSLAQGPRLKVTAGDTDKVSDVNETELILESLPQTGKMNLVELDIVKGGAGTPGVGPHNLQDLTLFKEVNRRV